MIVANSNLLIMQTRMQSFPFNEDQQNLPGAAQIWFRQVGYLHAFSLFVPYFLTMKWDFNFRPNIAKVDSKSENNLL